MGEAGGRWAQELAAVQARAAAAGVPPVQQRAGRSKLGHAVAIAVVVVALVAAAVLLTGVGMPSTAAPARQSAPTRRSATPAPHLRADRTDRVLFVGDSLMFGAADELRAELGRHAVDARFVGYPGTGLLSAQGMWLRGMADVIREWHPDVVVIEACCNYGNGEPLWREPDGHVVPKDTQEMYDVWQRQAQRAVDIATADGAAVRWVITPDVGPEVQTTVRLRVAGFERIAAGLGVERIDWRNPLEPEGTYSRTAVVDGRQVAIREDDDLHLTDAGDALVAAATWEALAPIFARRGA